jgi:hypothetical protein
VHPATRPATLTALALVLAGAPLAAQSVPDSLLARLRQTDSTLAALQARVDQLSEPTVRSRSRALVELTGLVLFNGYYNSGRTNNSDVPVYADTLAGAELAGLPARNVGAAARQTRLGLTVSEVRAIGAVVSATVQVDFFGGQQASTGGRTYPLVRLRVASVHVDWAHVGLLVGQDALLIAPQSPVSFASFATPLFAYSGNLWFRAPQVRLTAETSWSAHLGLQAAALAPMQPSPQGALLTQPDTAERSARPSVEARTYLSWGDGDAASEIGVGGHLGWLATTGDTLLQSQVVAADARIAFGRHVAISGEAFIGQALGTFGGGVGQNLGVAQVPVHSRGGWAQLDIRPGGGWQLGGGYGIDDPDTGDLPITGRGRNVTIAGHLIWRPGGGLLFGTEFRQIQTTYAAGTLTVNHVNAYAGLAF